MNMLDIELDDQELLKDLEAISRKLVSPEDPVFTEEELLVVKKLRQKNSALTHLDLIEQFFANNSIPAGSRSH
jgi:hypothetical protein